MVVLDLVLTGAGAGAFLFALLLGSLSHMLIGMILVFLGALFLMGDLSRPWHAWRVLLRPRTSWISRGALGMIVFFVLGILHLISLWASYKGGTPVSGSPWTTGPVWLISLGAMTGISALFIIVYPGFLLSSMRSIVFWNSAFHPAVFLLSGLFCGLGVIYLIPYPWETEPWGLSLIKGLCAGLIIMGCLFLFLLILMVHSERGRESSIPARNRSVPLHFHLGVMVVGILAPIVIAALVMGRVVSTSLLPLAGAPLVIGMICLRYSILKGGIHRKVI